MPMQRHLYPENWEAIALAVKEEAGWQCQECGKPCRKRGESLEDFTERLAELDPNENCWMPDLYEEYHDEETGEWGEVPHPQRFTLTVAHLNHRPEDCDRVNLKALCAPCHCRYDLQPTSMAIKKRLKAERDGQLNLLNLLGELDNATA